MLRDRSRDIAVIGVASRFPGPRELSDWWDALLKGHVLTTRLSKEKLDEIGVPKFLTDDPEYIPVRGFLDDADRFDNKSFRVNPRDAEMLDPQHRLMLEASWCALEDAGYGNIENRPVTGVFASGSGSGYARTILSKGILEPDLLEQVIHGTEPDFIASLISYKLNLTGPAIAVQTACSSSLVGLHLACQALNNGDCEQALVVAAGIAFPQGGYLHIPGGINSGTGVCSPFDEKANGVVEGSGVACVVLRRLEDLSNTAVEPHGIILGTAINNDGDSKAGYYAPSITGQISVIKKAIRNANVDPISIGYLETHGTGTHIGDPIEWTSTSEAYKELGAQRGQIAIGALKANIGHLDAASGLASLIKTMKVLKEGKVPPVANFTKLNPYMETDDSPLCVQNGKSHVWPNFKFRRGAVSSFGIGGTNAHVIMEQPQQDSVDELNNDDDKIQIIQISANDKEALKRSTKKLSKYLFKENPKLIDVAYTLKNARSDLSERLIVCGRTSKDIAKLLDNHDSAYIHQASVTANRPVVFMFTGQGSQRPGMAKSIAKTLPGFSDNLAACLRHFEDKLSNILTKALLDPSFPEDEINQTEIAQPALFAMGYGVAKSLISMGISPAAVVGHSLGEITAAYFAGAFNLETAVKLVTERGKSMQNCPEGAMLAVNTNLSDLNELLGRASIDLCVTAINSHDSCVVGGKKDNIKKFKNMLGGKIRSTILNTNRAFHSQLIEPALEDFKEVLSQIKLEPLKIPIVLNVSGELLKEGEELSSDYFLQQARMPVKFLDSMLCLRDSFSKPLLVEIGLGQTLSSLASTSGLESLPLCPNQSQDIQLEVMTSLGTLWTFGCAVDLSEFSFGGRLIHLPTYPFYGPRWLAPEVIRGLNVSQTTFPIISQHTDLNLSQEKLTPDLKNVRNVVMRLWKETLRHNNVDDASDFYSLGGDSLLITSLIRKINQAFDIKVPPIKLLLAKTLRGQVSLIEEVINSQLENSCDSESI